MKKNHSILLVLILIVLLAGCQTTKNTYTPAVGGASERIKCKVDPESCMYYGGYEEDERYYAEQRAKELNNQSKIRQRKKRKILIPIF